MYAWDGIVRSDRHVATAESYSSRSALDRRHRPRAWMLLVAAILMLGDPVPAQVPLNLHVAPDDRSLMASTLDGRVYVIGADDGGVICSFRCAGRVLSQARLSADGRTVTTVSWRKERRKLRWHIMRYDTRTHATRSVSVVGDIPARQSLSPSGDLAVVQPEPTLLKTWRGHQFDSTDVRDPRLENAVFLRCTEQRIFIVTRDGRIGTLDVSERNGKHGKIQWQSGMFDHTAVRSVEVSPDDQRLAVISLRDGYDKYECALLTMRGNTWRKQWMRDRITHGLPQFFAPRGDWMVLGDNDTSVVVVDSLSGQVVHRLQFERVHQGISASAWHPNGSEVALAFGNGAVAICAVGDAAQIRWLQPTKDRIVLLRYASSGRFLVFCTEGNIVCRIDGDGETRELFDLANHERKKTASKSQPSSR